MTPHHDLTTLPITAELTEQARGWYEAVELGFHHAKPSDDSASRWWRTVQDDQLRLRAVLHDNTTGSADGAIPSLPDPHPVATYASFDATINTGAAHLEPANLITDVTVRPTHRRRGLLRSMITTDLTEARERGQALAALTATEGSIYGRFGFGIATTDQRIDLTTTRRFSLTHNPAGRVEMIAPADLQPLAEQIFATFHATHRGSHDRLSFYRWLVSGEWEPREEGPNKWLRGAIHLDPDGHPDGYLTYTVKNRREHLVVEDMVCISADAELGLWEFLASVDLVEKVRFGSFHSASPLRWALADPRILQVTSIEDATWLRILDPQRALAVRGFDADGSIVVGIRDELGFAEGTFALEVLDGHAEVTSTRQEPQVSLDVATLASLYFGLTTAHTQAAAGRLSGDAAAITQLTRLFATDDAPHNLTFF